MIGFGASRMRALEARTVEFLKKMSELLEIPRNEKWRG
jgi:hypothetical protein